MGVLDSLPGIIAGAAGGALFSDLTLIRVAKTASDGRGGFTETKTTYAARGIVTEYSEFKRLVGNLPHNARQCILQAEGLVVTPRRDDLIDLDSVCWKILEVTSPPGQPIFECMVEETNLSDSGDVLLAQITGGLSISLDAIGQNISGENLDPNADNDGAVSQQLALIIANGVGDVDIVGGLSQQLQAIVMNASGANTITGVLSQTLQPITIAAGATQAIDGAMQQELEAIVGNATGDVDISGLGGGVLSPVAIAASGGVVASGGLTQQLQAIGMNLSGDVDIVGAAAATLEPITISTVASNPIGGTVSQGLGNVTINAVGTVTGGGGPAPTLPDLQANLVAYWSLDDGVDATGRGNDLTGVNSPGHAAGLHGNAFQGDGSGYYEVTDNDDVGFTGDFSIQLWYEHVNGNWRNLASKGSSNFGESEWNLSLAFDGGGSIGEIEFNLHENINQQVTGYTFGASANGWDHIVVTYDASTLISRIYVNGVLEGTYTHNGNVERETAPLRIGIGDSLANGTSGKIDEFGLWKEVLTQDKIDALYNSGAGRSYSEIAASAPTYSFRNSEAGLVSRNMPNEPDDARKEIIDRFFDKVSLQDTWDQVRAFWPMVSFDESSARMEWKTPGSFALTDGGTPEYHVDGGFSFDANADYLDTNWQVDRDGVDLTAGNGSFGIWTLEDFQSGNNHTLMGVKLEASGGAEIDVTAPSSGGRSSRAFSSATASASAIAGVREGLYMASKSDSVTVRHFWDGDFVEQDTHQAWQEYDTADAAANNLYLGNENTGSGPSNGYRGRHGGAFVGASMSDDQAWCLYEAWRNYLYDVGAFTYEDDFTGGPTESPLGDPWTYQTTETSGLQYSADGNHLRLFKVTGNGDTIATLDPGATDHFIELGNNLFPAINLSAISPMVLVRYVDQNNYAGVTFGNSTQGFTFRKVVGGVNTSLGNTTENRIEGSTIRVEARGDELILLQNSVELLRVSLGGDLAGGALVGMRNVDGGPTNNAAFSFIKAGAVNIFRDNYADRADGLAASTEDYELAPGSSDPQKAAFSGGQLTLNNGGPSIFVAVSKVKSVDGYIEYEVVDDDDGNFVAARATDLNNYVGVRTRLANGRLELRACVGGGFTTLANYSNVAYVGDIVRLEVIGSICNVRVNGELVGSNVDISAVIATGNLFGFAARSAGGLFNTIEVGSL